MQTDTLVVNFFAGAGASKSSLVANVFAELKWLDSDKELNVEIAPEFAKDLVWEERFDTLANQIYVFGKQYQRIRRLIGKVDVILTDSPLLFSVLYKPDYLSETFVKLVLEAHNEFNNLNFLVERCKKYNPTGRMQTEEQAKQFDQRMKFILDEGMVDYIPIPGKKESVKTIVDNILERV